MCTEWQSNFDMGHSCELAERHQIFLSLHNCVVFLSSTSVKTVFTKKTILYKQQ